MNTDREMKRLFTSVCLVAALVALAGCDRQKVNEILHPTRDNMAPESAATITSDPLPRDLSPPIVPRLSAAKAAIFGAQTTLQLGDDRGGHETFGSIGDVAVGSAGKVFVLDAHAQEIRVFDSSGRFMETFGGIGDGPMEFRSANGIELLADESLVVSTFSGQVKRFARSDTEWELRDIIQLQGMETRDLCSTANKRIVVTGHRRENNTLIHELSMQDGTIRSFGRGYQDDHWLVQTIMGQGVIGCLDDPDRVVFSFASHGIVRSFNLATEEEIWVSRIADFVSRPIYERIGANQEQSVRRTRAAQWDVVGAVHPMLPGILLIQVARFELETETVTVRSYLVNAASGAGALLGDRLPPIVSAPGGYVALFEDPYPRLEVREFVWADATTQGG